MALHKLKTSALTVVICLLAFSGSAQKSLLTDEEVTKIDSLKAIDWLSHDYKHLDQDFNMVITDAQFQQTIEDGKFIKERITSHNDSLSVVLYRDLGNFDAVRIAKLRIDYSWERLGWNLLMNENEAQQLASRLGMKLPYRVKEFLEDEQNNTPERLAILNNLRTEVAQLEQVTENVEELSLKELFNRAFRYSPERLEKVAQIHAARKAASGKK
jgi:hypothetical protein